MSEEGKPRAGLRNSGTAARSRAAACSAGARPAPARSAPPCWCPHPGEPPSARPSPTRSARCSRCRARLPPAARRRWSASRWRSDRINKSGGINGRPVELIVADYESKPDVGRRKAEKLVVEDKIDAAGRRLPVQRVPGLHAGVGGAQDRQHDQRVPRHDDHRQQVQPLHLPALRLRAGPGGGLRALPGRQDGQEVAHRLCRLLLGPVDEGRLRRRDQEGRRRGRRHHRHPARHRRHDAVPVQDHRRLRRLVRHLLRQGRRDHRQPGLRSRPDQEVQVGR